MILPSRSPPLVVSGRSPLIRAIILSSVLSVARRDSERRGEELVPRARSLHCIDALASPLIPARLSPCNCDANRIAGIRIGIPYERSSRHHSRQWGSSTLSNGPRAFASMLRLCPSGGIAELRVTTAAARLRSFPYAAGGHSRTTWNEGHYFTLKGQTTAVSNGKAVVAQDDPTRTRYLAVA